MLEGNVTTTSMKISFKVPVQPKKDANKLQTNAKFQDMAIKEDEDEIEIIETRKRNVICLENGVIKTDEVEKKKEKKEYCIAIQKTYDWRIQKLQKLVEENIATEEDKARLELMIEVFGGNAVKTESNDEKTISGTGHDITQGSSLEADYDEIPINEFGQAFLRGCGWKKEEGIGRTNKRVVALHVSEARPKGLGLGSHIPGKPPSKSERNDKDGNDENEATLKKRTRVKILSGIHQGVYAEVRSLDEDNSSCFVELLNENGKRNGVVARVSQFVLQIQSSKSEKDSSSSSSRERSSTSRESPTLSKKCPSSSLRRSSSSFKSRHSDNRR